MIFEKNIACALGIEKVILSGEIMSNFCGQK